MKFDPRPYTVVKSIAQLGLLKWWSRPERKGRLPSRADSDDEELARLTQDLALYQVRHEEGRLRYKCLRHGSGLRPIDGGDLTGRYLDEFFPEPLRTSALAAYDATVTMACPIYTLRNAVDARHVPVTFERIRLPLSEGDRIDHLLTRLDDRAHVSTAHYLPRERGTDRQDVYSYLQVNDGLLVADVVARLTVNL